MIFRICLLLLISVLSMTAHADPAGPFDLAGPTLEAKVTRGTATLPMSSVPNLAEGDQLWIKADLPSTQSVNYLLIVAFLSGSTNPPPKDWFSSCKTWKSCGRDGMTVTVPKGAQQVLVFMAPETSGDFRTVVGAVRGRPGAFVRASQDLNQAALDRSRLQRYLTTVRVLNENDPAKLQEVAPLMARSLAIKVDQKCLEKIPELQAPCLMQNQNTLVLADGHTASIVESLTSGPSGDLLMDVSATERFRYGYYSPYIASVFDIARILDSFRTATYSYIPALADLNGEKLNLTLNTPPSFNDPKSVLVIGLPAVEEPQLPPLHAVDPSEIYCANKTSLVLPVEGAPLAFSTDYAHDITLTFTGTDGKSINLPAKANAARGGYVVDTSNLQTSNLGDTVHATLQGYWGFTPYTGPGFQLKNAHSNTWALADADTQGIIVGRQETIHLQAESSSCIDSIMLKDPSGKELKAEWKALSPNKLEVKLPLQDAQPGAVSLMVTQYGIEQAQTISMQGFADAGHIEGFSIHAGDNQGTLSGSRLDEVSKLSFGKVNFIPGALVTQGSSDKLSMTTQTDQDTQAAAAMKPSSVTAKVTLKDGRTFQTTALIDAPRPSATLIGKYVQRSLSTSEFPIQVNNPDALPLNAALTFSLRAVAPDKFARDELVEIATADESFSTNLGLSNNGLRLENSKVAVATFDPAKTFGPSAYGPLKFRVTYKGVSGDWQPLATLTRLPTLKKLKCPADTGLACKLSGSDLYLVEAVSNDAQFNQPALIPEGFTGETFVVPRTVSGLLYLKLRDDPSSIYSVQMSSPPITSTKNQDNSSRAPEHH